jgi:hypothetical protein
MKGMDDWQAVLSRLCAAGFSVSYVRISYQPKNPLWRANAGGEGREWSTLGRDLRTTLLQLEEQTHGIMPDWRSAAESDDCHTEGARSGSRISND